MGKASLPKSGINDTLDANRERKKQFGRERAAFSGVQGTSSTIGGGFNTTGNNTVQAAALPTAGGTMTGPIAFNAPSKLYYPTSANNNTLDISQNTGLNSTYWVWPAGGSSTLEIISGAQFSGQILFVEITQTQTETIKDRSNTSGGNTGNIKTLDGNDLVLGTDKTIVLFMFSSIDNIWHQVSNPSVGGGSGGWVGTAASDLNMATYDINLNGNELFMDADADTSIYSTADDTLTFMVGASVKLTMTNTQILFANDVTLLGGFADLNVGGNTINFLVTGQTIDSTASGITYNVPTSDSHYFAVNGVTALQIGATDTTHYNNVKPASTLTYDLGSSSQRYRYIYALQIVDLSALTMDGDIDMNGNDIDDVGGFINTGNLTFSWSGTGSFQVSSNVCALYSPNIYIGQSTGDNVGFFGATPVGKQYIPPNATLPNIIAALRNLGLGS